MTFLVHDAGRAKQDVGQALRGVDKCGAKTRNIDSSFCYRYADIVLKHGTWARNASAAGTRFSNRLLLRVGCM